MKKTLIIIFLIAGIAQATNVIIPHLRPSKQELPEIIIPTSSEIGKYKMYATTVSFDIASCPRDNKIPSQDTREGNAEDSVVYATHCKTCNLGVFSKQEEESTRRCSFCGVRE